MSRHIIEAEITCRFQPVGLTDMESGQMVVEIEYDYSPGRPAYTPRGEYAPIDVDGGPITGYTSQIRIHCIDCGLPFRFLGLSAGSHFAEPRVSADATELRAPLEPAYVTEVLGMPVGSAGRA